MEAGEITQSKSDILECTTTQYILKLFRALLVLKFSGTSEWTPADLHSLISTCLTRAEASPTQLMAACSASYPIMPQKLHTSLPIWSLSGSSFKRQSDLTKHSPGDWKTCDGLLEWKDNPISPRGHSLILVFIKQTLITRATFTSQKLVNRFACDRYMQYNCSVKCQYGKCNVKCILTCRAALDWSSSKQKKYTFTLRDHFLAIILHNKK